VAVTDQRRIILPDVQYDGDTDMLYARQHLFAPTEDEPASTMEHVEDEVWIIRNLKTGRPIGIMIEDFERVFLKRHPDIALMWMESRQPWRKWSREVRESFNRVLAGWADREVKELEGAFGSACAA
jgi:hypothetical protein